MTKLVWDKTGSRQFEAGVDRGVFYPQADAGVAWNGLTTVAEDVDDSDQKIVYVDGIKSINQLLLGTFAADIGAVTYPPEFEPYDGYDYILANQNRMAFGLSYRTLIGNDLDNLDSGYKIHIVYNCVASPTTRENKSLSQSPDISLFTWRISTTPVLLFGDSRPTSHIVIDTRYVNPGLIEALEEFLYGSEFVDPTFPSIDDLITIFDDNAGIKVTDNGDGTATISGPDESVDLILSDTVELTWPLVHQKSVDTFNISSY